MTLKQKWVGAPFAAMLRRHQADNTESNDCILRIVCVLVSNSSDVVQVQYSSIALQPIDLNVDEETLMKVVALWRTSLGDSVSRQYCFDHFEIQPIKVLSNSSANVSAVKDCQEQNLTSLQIAGSSVLFAAVSEMSDSVLKEAEASGFNGMVIGFHQAMEPSLLGSALMEGGPDRKIRLDRNPGVVELYIKGYLQAVLDILYRQEYLRVRVVGQSEEIVERVKGFLVSKALLKGDPSRTSPPLGHLRGESVIFNISSNVNLSFVSFS